MLRTNRTRETTRPRTPTISAHSWSARSLASAQGIVGVIQEFTGRRRPHWKPEEEVASALDESCEESADSDCCGHHSEHPGASMSVAWMSIGRSCRQLASP